MDTYGSKAWMESTKAKMDQILESPERSNGTVGSAIAREMGGLESQSANLVDLAAKLAAILSPILKPEPPSTDKLGKSEAVTVPLAQALAGYNNQLARTRAILEGILSRVDL
jgi:hypothetical protein